MSHTKRAAVWCTIALGGAVVFGGFGAQAKSLRTVFVIAMENHNWTQPANQFTGGIQQIYLNPAAPFINSLVDGTAVGISEDVAFATAYHNVLATPGGNNPHIHPSEPNYLWAEAGTNFGVLNDNDPYGANGTNQNTSAHLSTLLTNAGYSWRSYQEDTDTVVNNAGRSNFPLPPALWTVPLSSFQGNFVSGFNAYNFSTQFNYAAKHNPQVFFSDTNGGNDPTPSNPLSSHYAPLQQLSVDLSDGTTADYNWITPNQHNDQHTTLAAGFQGLSGDPAKIKQGDVFLSQVVPMIRASDAYKNHGVIVLWWDEAESDGVAGDNADDFTHTLPFIIISKDAHKNVDGVPYGSPLNFSHSSFLRTMQDIFQVGPYLGDAVNALDLSDLFKPGSFAPLKTGK